MKGLEREPEYRRRIREKTEQDQDKAEAERQKAADNAKNYEIIRSIYSIVRECQRSNNEERSRKQGDRFWEIAGVAGLWLAAAVGITAIWYGTHDASEQRRVMTEQLGTMRGQLDEMRAEQRPWLFAPEIALTERVRRDDNGILVSLGFKFTNSGHLPASNVYVHLSALATHNTGYAAAERENCDQRMDYIGTSVFPNFTTQQSNWATYISNEQISAAEKDYPPTLKRLWPMVLACIVYRDPLGIDHHTPYILEFIAIKNGVINLVIPSEAEELSRSEIRVQQAIRTGMAPD